MKIYSINQCEQLKNYSQKKNLGINQSKQTDADVLNYLSQSLASISFKASRRVPVKGLELQKEEAIELTQNVMKRLTSLNNKNLRGEFLRPFVVKSKEKSYGFILNNSDTNYTQLTL